VEVYSYTTQNDLAYETGFGFDVLFGVQLGLARRRHVMEIELKDLRRPERIGRLPSEDHASYLRNRGLPDRAPTQRQVSMLTYHRVAQAQGGATQPRSPWPENRTPNERLWDEDDGGDDDYSFNHSGIGSGGRSTGSGFQSAAFTAPRSPGRSTGTYIHLSQPPFVHPLLTPISPSHVTRRVRH
jgi:hypothetical protein